MTDIPNDFSQRIDTALAAVDAHPSGSIDLFHHNDTDGLTSGAILQSAFMRSGYEVSVSALEKPYPLVLEKIFEQEGKIIVFADFAGKIAPLISRMNGGRNLVIIVDHHPAESVDDPSVIVVDADLFGLKGDRDISASATSYLFAERLDAENADLVHLGVLGAIGDGFFVDGALSGINRSLLLAAQGRGSMRAEQIGEGAVAQAESYRVRLEKEYPAGDVCSALDTLGGVGYYRDGASKGRRLCLSGFDSQLSAEVEELQATKERIFREEIARLRSRGLNSTARIQWFDVEERFRPMGVKMIGVFCTIIRNMDFLDHGKYLAGFQTLPDEVPGFGAIDFDSKKISMRVSDYLTEEIRGGRMPGLSAFLPEATLRLGGFADACHGLSAATTIGRGWEQRLMEETEQVLAEKMVASKNDGEKNHGSGENDE